MKVLDHKLCDDAGNPVTFRESPNKSGSTTPEYLVMHYTAGSSAGSSINWLCNPDARASAHLVIGRDGDITQLVRFDERAWHAGRSKWADRVGLNRWSLGIELDNCGVLSQSGGVWRNAWGREIATTEVAEAAHKNGGPVRGWHAYTTAQLEVATEVAASLVAHYGLKNVIGHDDIAPARKTDPGPAFPMESIRAAAVGRDDPEDEADAADGVTTTVLNIRSGPGLGHEKLEEGPLPKGTRLEFRSHEGLWLEVVALTPVQGQSNIEGWVHGRYVERF